MPPAPDSCSGRSLDRLFFRHPNKPIIPREAGDPSSAVNYATALKLKGAQSSPALSLEGFLRAGSHDMTPQPCLFAVHCTAIVGSGFMPASGGSRLGGQGFSPDIKLQLEWALAPEDSDISSISMALCFLRGEAFPFPRVVFSSLCTLCPLW